MSLYLFLNILIIIFPLTLSFERKIGYYKKIIPVLGSVLIVSLIFIIWDSIATYRGDWGFNEEHITGIELINLPIEEIFFFITVPFSILFLYETIILYLPDKKVYFNKYIYGAVGIFLMLLSFLNYSKYYTFTVFLFNAVFLFTASMWFKEILWSRNYWLLIIISYIPFLIFNYILTSIPIVWYSPDAILGFRVLTIPIEDFFYSYSLISAYLLVYLSFKEKWQKKKEQQ